ncbi:MAG: amylo-alpha-1,6-glucosidase [Hamadaea sp.]|uniref:amylo-alpha-1,6-glucosidase n=1 Tax=Hamadaea sp. TaxID=2024425 RepID=UPI0017947223|nr:glycogen debranching N-terminal domain-containing protein [Hamadaea sp.]NUR71980.1 amylo-alpha-1,6-glucosidase [Hamadaea sp.]NUT22952.1 amylo-alpha-1,6-glucosidase [Hamadaea sp.]
MPDRQINILQGRTFMVSDERGDVAPNYDEPGGLFFRDMRHLSRWELRLNGRPLASLSGQPVEYDEAVFYLQQPTGTVYLNPVLSVLRRRHVGEGVQEQLKVTNHGARPAVLELSLLFDADFADIFEVKDKQGKTGRHYRRIEKGAAVLGYERGEFRRETRIKAPGARFTEQSMSYALELAPTETWSTEIEISVATAAIRPVPHLDHRPQMPISLEDWLAQAPELDTDWDDLVHTYRRSLIDLAALRFYPDTVPDASLPAAGLPWFMALFGRDSLIVGYQTLPYAPELCRTTLRALAAQQASAMDDVRDAEPGKILHELRHGELTYFGQRPQSPYYGSADSTPLFLIVLDEYFRWTGDSATVCDLEQQAKAAIRWMREFGDADGDLFIEYATRNPEQGLVNQCWKDSWNAIVHPDGTLATLPRATCEIQGYAYDARIRAARLARACWNDHALAESLEEEARLLQERFVEAYWLPDEGFYALALDGQKRPVPTLTSNIGHLLWSGIVPPDHAPSVVAHLMGPAMFSGWGVRTLAEGLTAYNPMEYHNGTVWPHDNAIVAAGLARYGFREEAALISEAMLTAAALSGFRLPEALIGTARELTEIPIAYPSACSPQAWAAGTPLMLLRTLLGLEPDGDRLTADPHLPSRCGRLMLRGVPGVWGKADAGV